MSIHLQVSLYIFLISLNNFLASNSEIIGEKILEKDTRKILIIPVVRAAGWYKPTSLLGKKYPSISTSTQCIIMPNTPTSINGMEKNNISLAVCTNKTEKLAVDLLKKLKMYNNFEYVAGHDTFEFCKPDARHLTNVIEILGGNLKKTLMVGDSEVAAQAALNAKLPFILIKNGYTEKTSDEIRHNHLIEDYINFENLIKKYL